MILSTTYWKDKISFCCGPLFSMHGTGKIVNGNTDLSRRTTEMIWRNQLFIFICFLWLLGYLFVSFLWWCEFHFTVWFVVLCYVLGLSRTKSFFLSDLEVYGLKGTEAVSWNWKPCFLILQHLNTQKRVWSHTLTHMQLPNKDMHKGETKKYTIKRDPDMHQYRYIQRRRMPTYTHMNTHTLKHTIITEGALWVFGFGCSQQQNYL